MKSVVIDSNLLVLLVVGSAGLNLIAVNRHTKGFSIADFDILRQLINNYRTIVLLPGILAETSNLARRDVAEPGFSSVMDRLRAVIDNCAEASLPSAIGADRPEFQRLGLVDASILALCSSSRADISLLTFDQPLAREAGRLGIEVENFQDWR